MAFESHQVKVRSPNVSYDADYITTKYSYDTVEVDRTYSASSPSSTGESFIVTPKTRNYTIQTNRKIPRTGLMIVGIGGNNGTTVVAGTLANKKRLEWRTRKGVQKSNWYGSMLLSSVAKLGNDSVSGEEIFVPLTQLLPICDPCQLVIGGWDVSSMRMGDAMRRAAVLDVTLQDLLYGEMQSTATHQPLPAVYFGNFIAKNQGNRVDNILKGNKQELLDQVRGQIRNFKRQHSLEKVIVMWSATTERFVDLIDGVNDTADNLLRSIESNVEEGIAPSTIYATAAILEDCSYINGSPQNTFTAGVEDLAIRMNVFIGGDDFKSGQTKVKSCLVDFLVSSGIKPRSIASYNHLGNNDGYNLSAPEQFRSKEISKSNVVDDMIESNRILYKKNETIDHAVVIKYIPYVGDSKRAMDEYSSDIFLGGNNCIVLHNTCEDSLLAAPLIIDMVLLTELSGRIKISEGVQQKPETMHSVLSLLSLFCKAPLVPQGAPRVNAFFSQRESIINLFRACIGLPPQNHMLLEHKLKSFTSSWNHKNCPN